MNDLAPRLDTLDPLQRADFDAQAVRRWRVTWPDGSSEIIQCHMTQRHGADCIGFYWLYLGAHRVINLQHVRDIAELPVAE